MLSGFRSQHLHVQLQERRAEWQGNDNQNLRGSSAGGRGARLQHSSNAGRISSQQQERQDHTSCLQAVAHLVPNGALVQDAVQVGCRVDALACMCGALQQGPIRPWEHNAPWRIHSRLLQYASTCPSACAAPCSPAPVAHR